MTLLEIKMSHDDIELSELEKRELLLNVNIDEDSKAYFTNLNSVEFKMALANPYSVIM